MIIISGAQTGVDRAALDAAIELGIPYSGSIPKDRRAEDGRVPDHYNLIELTSYNYQDRTKVNVLDSDGTLIIAEGELSGGTKLTLNFCRQYQKPALVIDPVNTMEFLSIELIQAFIKDNNITTLNVAGPRESTWPEAYNETKSLLKKVF